MSKNQTPASDSIVEGEVLSANPETKQSFFQKISTPIKKHPKIATAVGLGVALVAGAAILGKENSEVEEYGPENPSPEMMDEAREALESFGIPVTDEG